MIKLSWIFAVYFKPLHEGDACGAVVLVEDCLPQQLGWLAPASLAASQ
jgi:hypothetical protein